MKRSYIDANVLITAFQGDESISRRAMEVLNDPDRALVISDYLRLEVLPKPTFHKRQEEVEFMEAVLESASETIPARDFCLLFGKTDLGRLFSKWNRQDGQNTKTKRQSRGQLCLFARRTNNEGSWFYVNLGDRRGFKLAS